MVEASGRRAWRGVAPSGVTARLATADCGTVINENWIYLGTAIGALGAAVYLRDTLRGTTKPNRVTWLLWAVAPLLAAAVELHEGVGLRALPTFMVGLHAAARSSSARSTTRPRCGRSGGSTTRAAPCRSSAPSSGSSTRNGVLAISAAIAADFLAGVPTLMKSWTHPETETVHSYIGAVISMGILLLTIDHWTFDEAGLPTLHRLHGVGRGRSDRARARATPAPAPPPAAVAEATPLA